MKIQLSQKQLNNPKYAKLKQRIEEHNATFMQNTKSKITQKDTTMVKTRKTQRKNPNGFNFDNKLISNWRAHTNVESPVAEIGPIDSYFESEKGWLKVTPIAIANGFDHHHWIKARPVTTAIADITRTYPSLTLRDMVVALPRRYTAYHPFLASLFLKTITVKPEFKDTLKQLKERVDTNVQELVTHLSKWEDQMEDRALIANMRRTRGDMIQEEIWALDYNSDVSGYPFHSVAKKFGISAVDLHQACVGLGLITPNGNVWTPTRKALDEKLMRELKNVNGDMTTYPWITKKGIAALYQVLETTDHFPQDDYAVQYTAEQLSVHTFN